MGAEHVIASRSRLYNASRAGALSRIDGDRFAVTEFLDGRSALVLEDLVGELVRLVGNVGTCNNSTVWYPATVP